MNELIRIGNQEIMVKEYNGQRVITFKDIDIVHERPDGTASRNFRQHREKFIEGVDYFKITSDEFRRTIGDMNIKQQNDVTLITESGYLMLTKSLNDDTAWKVHRELVNTYFRVRKHLSQLEILQQSLDILVEQDKHLNAIDKTIDDLKNEIPPNLKDEIKDIKNTQKKMKEDNEVLCSFRFRGYRKRFMAKASARVREILGGTNTPEYVLFHSFFHKGIYSDIAYKMEVPNWDDISMENYDKENSVYDKAQDVRDEWLPSRHYFNHCLNQLVEKRDNGILSAERCRALTTFLTATNNATNVPFVR